MKKEKRKSFNRIQFALAYNTDNSLFVGDF